MSTKEKIKQQLDQITESELCRISDLINKFKGKSAKDARQTSSSSLKIRDFSGKLDHANVRDIAMIERILVDTWIGK